MLSLPTSMYAQWRVRCGAAQLLRDEFDSPPERLLQAIWLHQRLQRDRLRTLDGRSVRVLHPGFHNLEGGPDFRDAVIQMGEEPPRSGDVEVDLRSQGWRAHGHDRNRAFARVILHVIWDVEQSVLGTPPILPLRHVLDASLGELSLWLGGEAAQAWPEALRGKCCAPLRDLPAARLEELLRQAAQIRLQSKAAQFEARARQAGWEQALWEGLFRALGYKHNIWPMQCLAELRQRWAAERPEPLLLQARLMGISGLLPVDLSRSGARKDGYLRKIWDQWWRERAEFADCVLPRELWRMHGLRPANHPQRRLALAAGWSVQNDLPARVEQWCALEIPDKRLVSSLVKTLQAEAGDFWAWHCTFQSAPFRAALPLLGPTRATDLAVNVVLPWLWTRAREGNNEALQKIILRRYDVWPAAQDNSLLRLARERLLGGVSERAFTTAAAQQGLIQIVRDFCEHSNAICERCKFPELALEWRTASD